MHILEQYLIAYCALTSRSSSSSSWLFDIDDASFVAIHSLPLLLMDDIDFVSLVDGWIPPPKADIQSIKHRE